MSDAAASAAAGSADGAQGGQGTQGQQGQQGSAAQGQGQAANNSWYAGFDEDTQAWMGTNGMKNLPDHKEATSFLVKGYRNLERLLGADKAGNAVIVPKETAAPQEFDAFYNRLGRPESPDKYDFKSETVVDKEVDWLKGTLHKIGLSGNQAKAFVKEVDSFRQNELKAEAEGYKTGVQKDEQGLKQEWGAAFERCTNEAKQGVAALGLDEDTINAMEGAMGYGKLMRTMQKIGQMTGEHGFVQGKDSGNKFNGKLTPAEAKSRLDSVKKDQDWMRRYIAGGSAERAEFDSLTRASVGM